MAKSIFSASHGHLAHINCKSFISQLIFKARRSAIWLVQGGELLTSVTDSKSDMALAASRPNNSKRYSRSRPESVASDYQGLSIDREALKESYQQSLLAPSTSSIGLSASGSVNSSQSRFTGQGSQEANSTTQTHLSIPSHGHGHGTRPGFQRSSLSPIPTGERSNLYSPTSTNEQMAFRLPPYPALASPPKPTIPPRPTLPYEQSFAPSGTSSTQTHPSLPRSSSAMDVDSPGLTTSSEMFTSSPRAHGKARALPQIPTDVPPPVSCCL